jgi:N utilization substance protein A
LASKLIGWDIDIKSEEEKRREIEEQMTALTAPTTPLTALAGVGAKTIEKIEAAGITNVEKLAGMTPEQLMEIPGIGEKMVDKIYQAVNRFYEGGGEAAAAGEAAENAEGSTEEVAPSDQAEASAEGVAVETPEAEVEAEGSPEAAPEPHDEAAAPAPAENDAAGSDGVRTAEAPEEGDQKHSESDEEAKS